MTATAGQQYVRRCQQCQGQQWTDGGTVNGWPTIAPCAECRPGLAALLAVGAYAIDAPRLAEEPRWQQRHDQAEANATRRTALFPWPQLLTTWPAPGQRPPTQGGHP